jgi:transcriptional regulator with XRE-family HTH domain/preprotein translocase subunit YajC
MKVEKIERRKQKMTLGERLLAYRKNINLSQDALAEKIGVTRQTISKWETDQSMPDFNKIQPLCEVFNITTDELVKGEKEENKDTPIQNNNDEKRNQKKALIISISVFLYCIGAFSLPYMIESLKYEETHAIMISTTLFTIATVILVYFFISHPQNKTEKIKHIENKIQEANEVINELDSIDEKTANLATKEAKTKNKTETRILQLVAMFFLLSYFVVSVATEEWNVTWILWIVFIIVELIVKLIFDVRREKNEK